MREGPTRLQLARLYAPQARCPFRRTQAGKKPGTLAVVFAVCCFWPMIRRVAFLSGGGGVGGEGGWGEGGMLPSLRKACAHTNTHCQCTQVGACHMLTKSVWRATSVHHSKHELARRVSVTRARKRPACSIVGTQCMDKGWQSWQVYITTQLHSL